MRTVAQGHKGQQGPVVLDGRVEAVSGAEPPLDLGASGVVEVDDRDERDEVAAYAGAGAASPAAAGTRCRRTVRARVRIPVSVPVDITARHPCRRLHIHCFFFVAAYYFVWVPALFLRLSGPWAERCRARKAVAATASFLCPPFPVRWSCDDSWLADWVGGQLARPNWFDKGK